MHFIAAGYNNKFTKELQTLRYTNMCLRLQSCLYSTALILGIADQLKRKQSVTSKTDNDML